MCVRKNSALYAELIGLGWDENSMNANNFDLDASVFMLHSENKIISDS
jgi:stress response protein SCP2